MKKTIFILICTVSVLLLVSVAVIASQEDYRLAFLRFFNESKSFRENDVIAVTVNGAPIYQSEIKTALSFSELSNKLAVNQIENMDVDENTKQNLLSQQIKNKKTEETVLNNLIEEKVLLQEAQRCDITVSEETARAFAIEQYSLAKKAATLSDAVVDKRNYEFVLMYMEENNLTEEQYIDLTVKEYQKMLILEGLYDLLAKDSPNMVNENGFAQEYISALVSRAEIVYEN